MSKEHPQQDAKPEHGKRDEFLSKTGEKAEEYAKDYFSKVKEAHAEDHCQGCHNRVNKTEKMVKTTLIVSILAFLLSTASLALPFLTSDAVQFSPKEWEQFLTTLEESLKTETPAVPPPAGASTQKPAPSKPVTNKPASSAQQSSLMAAAVSSRAQSSTAVITSSSRVAVGDGVQSSSEQVTNSSQASSETAQESSVAQSSTAERSSVPPADGGAGMGKDPGTLKPWWTILGSNQ